MALIVSGFYVFDNPSGKIHCVVTKGHYKRKGACWFAYAVGRLPKSVEAHQVFEMYSQRFGIETSYRQTNQVRAHTNSRNPVIRLLLVGLAFVLFNLYISNRQRTAICLKILLSLFPNIG
jgi:hypothetical protein